MSFNQLKHPKAYPARQILPSAVFLQKRKFYTFLPVVVLPFLFLIFISLGGGKGAPAKQQTAATGFNTELPGARFDKKKPQGNKLDFYKQADQDSLRRKEYLRQDPYYNRRADTVQGLHADTDARAEQLLQKLERIKQSIQQPAAPPTTYTVPATHRTFEQKHIPLPPMSAADSTENDPQLEKLNGMLDKIIRIQHPNESVVEKAPEPAETSNGADTIANSLPAVVHEDQVLVAGATIALRLTESARINGVLLPKDQLVYGVVSISNDRMLITVNSVRKEQSIFSTALQVYDLDGLAGIHIPGSIGRETAKESADQGIHSVGMGAFDPSLTGQAVNAGVLTARTLLSRKVRLVRVTVRAGYRLLLRNTKEHGRLQVAAPIAVTAPDSLRTIPDPTIFLPFLHRSVHHEKMALTLEGVYLQDSLLWLVLRLENHSPIGYRPEYTRWCIRDKKQPRRTAIQEIPLTPLYSPPVETLAGDSARVLLTAFRPFALPREKELVLQLAEGNGARELVMEIGEKELLKARKYAQP